MSQTIGRLEVELYAVLTERNTMAADIERLQAKVKNLVQQLDDHLGTPCEQIRHEQEIERLRALLNAVRIWMKNIDRRPAEEPLYQAIRAALENKP